MNKYEFLTNKKFSNYKFNITDPNSDATFVSSSDDSNPWIAIDLGSTKNVQKVVLTYSGNYINYFSNN